MTLDIVKSIYFVLSVSSTVAAHATGPPPSETYDFIIVGGGTAGNALATRLSQGLPKDKILVIEAGPAAQNDDNINIPGFKGRNMGGKYDWSFPTIPQPGFNGRAYNVPRGKVLGGSSAINYITFDRAAAAEYDMWAEVGNPGWNWKTMETAMEKAENYLGGPRGSGTKGPIQVLHNRNSPRIMDAFAPTASNLGIPRNDDSIQGNPIGVSYQPTNINPTSYNRSYSATAYLPLAKSNLKVLTDTLVVKVNLQKKGNLQQAMGVTLSDGTIIKARKEVILSAGAIQSPQLLELSGIGQASILKAAKIKQVIDLPGVGETYNEHLLVRMSFQLKDGYDTADKLAFNATFAAEQWARRLNNQSSFYDDAVAGYIFANWNQVLGDSGAASLVSLARSIVASKPSSPGLKMKLKQLSNPHIPQAEYIFVSNHGGATKTYPPPGHPLHGKPFVSIYGGLMHPLSEGSVHINTSSPLSKPIVDPKFLSNEYDIAALIGILKFARKLALETEPLKSIVVGEYDPGLDAVDNSDERLEEFVRRTTGTIFHPMTTAAMLPRRDGGVVDSKLAVYGTTGNLRVVDASVIPVQISAHPQSAVYGIAERAAEIIVGEWKK
ncbi:putative GMC oxidoreductase [Podospora fimiseda]|uniref:GMC oxidoreductase n=1 Tax=Podospora fimiseda TaxID=252190 RepID=A0AAN7BXL3_9PEZI|nr:putative GMC oxidoreductase [Podospora fimiseda]